MSAERLMLRLRWPSEPVGLGSQPGLSRTREDLFQAVDANTAKASPPVQTCSGVNNVVGLPQLLWVSTGTALMCVIDLETDEQQLIGLPAAGGIVAVDGASAYVSPPTEGQVVHVTPA